MTLIASYKDTVAYLTFYANGGKFVNSSGNMIQAEWSEGKTLNDYINNDFYQVEREGYKFLYWSYYNNGEKYDYDKPVVA